MSNAVGLGVTKRYLKPEERQVMCYVGYVTNNIYGTAASFSSFNYGGSSSCAGITVAGINDGIGPNGDYTFTGNVNTPILIAISTLLVNDRNATGFECLQDLTTGQMLASIGTGTSVVNLTITVAGLHLLRYVPTATINNVMQRGNITYVYVYISTPDFGTCIPTFSACDLIKNGSFEEKSGNPSERDQMYLSCRWGQYGSANYFNSNSLPITNVSIPCNIFGSENTNSNSGNAYAGFGIAQNPVSLWANYEYIKTKLITPLLANTAYKLTFDVSLSEYSNSSLRLQAFFSNNPNLIAIGGNPILGIGTNSLLFTNGTFSTNSSGWETITIKFTTSSVLTVEQYLYIGGLNYSAVNPTIFQVNNSPNIGVNGCPFIVSVVPSWATISYYYVDNISLTAADGTFKLPTTIACPTMQLNNLVQYTSGLPTNGTFTLTSQPANSGATSNTIYLLLGTWRFRTSGLVPGNYTISYNYTNNVGCPMSLSSTINVISGTITPTFSFGTTLTICSGQTIPLLPTTSMNGLIGTWSPNVLTTSGFYTFTSLANNCNNVTTLTFTNNSNLLVTNPDNVAINFSGANFTTTSILINDTAGGAFITTFNPNITTTLVGSLPTAQNGGLRLNSNGTITVSANTTPGTYALQYQISSGCSTSNVSTITLTIFAPITCPSKDSFRFCFSNIIQTQTYAQGFYNATRWTGGGILVNGQPGTPMNSTITSGSLPTGITLNPNGTFTIAASTGNALVATSFNFFVNICGGGGYVNNVGINITIDPALNVSGETYFVNNLGQQCASGSCPLDVLSNDVLCGGISAVVGTNVTLSNLTSSSTYFSIGANGLIVPQVGVAIPFGTYTLNYNVCLISLPLACFAAVTTIYVGNYASSRFANPETETIDKNESQFVIIAPNPSNGLFNLTFNNFADDYISIDIYNNLGQLVMQHRFTQQPDYQLNLEAVATGTYFVKITNGDNVFNERIFKN